MLNCRLTGNKSFNLIRMGRICANMGNSLCSIISFQILHVCLWSLTMSGLPLNIQMCIPYTLELKRMH